MQHDDGRTATPPPEGRTSELPRRLASARRSFCRHVRLVLRAQGCVVLFTGDAAGSRTIVGYDGIAANEARLLGTAPDDRTIGELGFAHGLSGTFPMADGVLRIAALRATGEPAFTAADAEALDSIGGLAVSILDIVGTATELSALWRSSMQVLDRLTVGIMLVGANGEILARNRTARDIALTHGEAGAGAIRRANGRTTDAAAAFARLESGLEGDGNGEVSVLATPLPPLPNGDGRQPRQAITALFLSDTGRLFAPYQDWLCRFYGLTRLEAQLVTQIVEGRSLGDIAASLRVSIHTVRSYLKQIFGKTGVHRQAGLVKLVVGGIGQVRADHDAARRASLSHRLRPSADAAQ